MVPEKKVLNPITILLFVTIIAAIATWFVPAGTYNKLSVVENTFAITSNGTNVYVKIKKKTLDSLQVLIPLEKFTSKDISKPVSIPNTYQPIKSNR